MILPLSALGLSLSTSVVVVTTGSIGHILPFASVLILVALGYLVYSRQPRVVTVETDGQKLRIEGYERQSLLLAPSKVTLHRWVRPVLGTRHGDALVVRSLAPAGGELVLTFGVANSELARVDDPPCEQVDISLGPSEFAELVEALHSDREVQDRGPLGVSTFVLVPHRGVGAVYAQILPWFGAMMAVGVLGALGEPLMRTLLGRVALFGTTIAALGGGIFYTFRRANKPQRELLLRLSRDFLILGDALTPQFQVRLPDLRERSEIHVFQTRYGTFRFPVLVLSNGTNELRVGVWEDYLTVGVPLAPEGAAPEYLVSTNEYRVLVKQLARRR